MKTLLVAMSRADTVYGTHPAHFAVLSGREVLQHGRGVADALRELPGRSLRLSLDSAANLTERVRLRALSRRFVPVLVQRHLAESGAFTERFRFRSRVVSLRQGEAEVDVLAMLEDDAALAQDLLPSEERPLTHLVTAEAAVAAFVGAATAAPVLVHWWHEGGLRTLGVRDGRVVWQRVQPFASQRPDPSTESWKPLLDAAATMAPMEFASASSHTLRLGDGPWAATGEWATNGSRELSQQLGALFKGVTPDVPLRHPELYGLAWVGRADSLIVNGYRQRVMAWHWAPPVAALAGLVGAVCLGLGIWWHGLADQSQAALQLELSTLSAQALTLEQQRPPAEAVAALRSAAWRETALGANLRADRFLAEMLAQVPEGAQVMRMHITRNDLATARIKTKDGQPAQLARKDGRGKGRADDNRQAKAEKPPSAQPVSVPLAFTPITPVRRMPGPGEPSFQVDLNIALDGGYEGAKLKAEALAEKLSELGRLSDTRLAFQDMGAKGPGASLQTRLTIAAGAF